jgi:hypothetical protein
VDAVELGQLDGQPRHELHLHAEADQGVEVHQRVRRRLVPLGVDEVDVVVDEDVLPGHEHVAQHHQGVDLIEPRR